MGFEAASLPGLKFQYLRSKSTAAIIPIRGRSTPHIVLHWAIDLTPPKSAPEAVLKCPLV